MRAVVLTEFGEPQVLRVAEVPVPVPAADEVLVRVHATALNRADLLQRRGLYPNPFPSAHDIPGMEFAGEVVEPASSPDLAHRRASRWKPGDHVMGIVAGGGHAEQLVIHERQAVRVPLGVDVRDAAAIPEVFLTAWDALVVQGGLTSGRWALVHAGASGVGSAAIQICRAIGARIAVTCSTGKVEACRDMGADVVIDYLTQDFVEETKKATAGRGVDVVLDVIGGDYLDRNVASLAIQGCIIQVGTMAGKAVPFNVGTLLPKRATITGTVLRPRPVEEKIALTQRFIREVLPLFETGQLSPLIDSRFRFDDIAAAHDRMAANANIGKIIVDVR